MSRYRITGAHFPSMTLHSGGPSLFLIEAAATIVTIGLALLVPAIVRHGLNHDPPRISAYRAIKSEP